MTRHARPVLALCFALLTSACASTRGELRGFATGFEESEPGAPPAGWRVGENEGAGRPAQWSVERDESAPRDPHVLTVRSTNGDRTFNWCVFDGPFDADAEFSVRLKPLGGATNQGGGLVLRMQGDGDYYLTRWNPLDRSVGLYVVRGGARTKLGGAEVAETGGWRRLAVRAAGRRFEVSFDDRPLFDATDDTFRGAGRAGLWSAGDATTGFDDFEVKPD